MIVLLFSEFLFSDMIFSGSGDSQSLAGFLAAFRLRNQALSFHPATTVKVTSQIRNGSLRRSKAACDVLMTTMPRNTMILASAFTESGGGFTTGTPVAFGELSRFSIITGVGIVVDSTSGLGRAPA